MFSLASYIWDNNGICESVFRLGTIVAVRNLSSVFVIVCNGGASGYIFRVQEFVYKMEDFRVWNLDYFPENILIDILSYLGVRELVRAGR